MTDKYAMRDPPHEKTIKPRLRFQVEPGLTKPITQQ